jgi:2-desacetyl-2-hydroxyethyl bacteriochlorophyllide A dehydrogenase
VPESNRVLMNGQWKMVRVRPVCYKGQNAIKMKTLVCIKPGKFEFKTAKKPEIAEGRSIIKIRRIGICGTDLHAFEGTQPFFEYPRILGHELSGELVAIDGAPDFSVGEGVTFIPYFSCGKCIACRSFKPNCCVNLKVSGVHQDGGMAEYLSVPSSSLVHNEGLDFDVLALVEPLAIGAHAVVRAEVKPGEYVLVAGAGPIGLGTMEFARIAGGKVIALDVNSNRLAFCRDRLKVEHIINAGDMDVMQQLLSITGNDMPTVVIDATGNLLAIQNAFQYIAHGGRYVMIGIQKGDVCLSHPEFHKREATLMSSRNATRANFEQVIGCMKRGQISPITYITHKVFFSDVKDQFTQWLDPANGVIKVMVEMD